MPPLYKLLVKINAKRKSFLSNWPFVIMSIDVHNQTMYIIMEVTQGEKETEQLKMLRLCLNRNKWIN